MTALPSIASFTAPTVTEGEFKTALSNLHLFLSGLLGTTGAAADAQAALGALLGAGVETKTGAYTVQPEDRGKVVACSGTFTVTLPDAGEVGDGFAVSVANYGAGTITVDPYSTQTIDGATTKALAANTMLVACTVAGEWLTVGGMTLPTASTSQAGIVQLSTSVSSTSTALAATASAVKAAYDLAAEKANASHTHSQYLDTDIGHNVVGSLCLAKWSVTGTGTVNPGNTVAGSALRAANLYSSHATALSGTWRCLGYAVSDGSGGHSIMTTLWQRIS